MLISIIKFVYFLLLLFCFVAITSNFNFFTIFYYFQALNLATSKFGYKTLVKVDLQFLAIASVFYIPLLIQSNLYY